MVTTMGFSWVLAISSLHMMSTSWNLLPSSGICFTMSSELKMGSRYSQVCWHLSQLSIRSCSVCIIVSRSLTWSLKGLAKGEALIAWIFTIWSSRMAWMSSVEARMKVPESL